jgi:sugar phosphate isomerase/epimerase
MLFCLNEPFTALMKRLGKVEVEHVEIVDEGIHALNDRRVSLLKKAIKARDLSLTVHAPFADINIASTSPFIRRAIIKRLEKSIVLSAQLNPKYWVFHPGIQSAVGDEYPGLDWKINLDSVRRLLKVAGQHGLKISIENQIHFHSCLRRLMTSRSFMRL